MKFPLFAACLLAACSASAQVSVTIGQPGFYGRIDLGGTAAPPVLYREPILVERPVRVVREPLYLRVPPGHARNWRKHCGKYRACGRRVLFVRDDWYLNDYAPRYRAQHHGWHDRHDRHRDERRDHRGDQGGRGHGDHDRGHGKGHGGGHNKGHGRD